ncbi:O-methyltransferase [Amycolatopsis sp. MtRt-6]|uniref:O-methyltransferase n=1 Tax=Amycolatopsis sp. MtRt-6 TaxID=2792782 RepID=UPI001A90A5E5|nr:O-methyltransferase [Amycolatopsis sp. MtRt-6]
MILSATADAVLDRLENRSREERPELDELNSRGARWTREAAPRLMLDVGPDVGRLLNILVRTSGAQHVVEIGGSVGYSTIWLASAVAETGGLVVSIETDDGKVQQLLKNVEEAGLQDYVEVAHGSADTVLTDLAGPFDLVLIDHWKDLYIREFDLVWPKIRPGGLVVADNILEPAATAERMRAYVEHVRSKPDACSYTVPLGDGIEITSRVLRRES